MPNGPITLANASPICPVYGPFSVCYLHLRTSPVHWSFVSCYTVTYSLMSGQCPSEMLWQYVNECLPLSAPLLHWNASEFVNLIKAGLLTSRKSIIEWMGFFFVHGMFSAFLSFTKWVNALFSIEAKYIAPNVTLYIALVYRSCSPSNSEGYVSRWVCQVIDVPSRLG